MGLADLSATVPNRIPGPPCGIARIRRRLLPKDLAVFDAFLADPDLWPGTRLAKLVRAMIANGDLPPEMAVREQTITRHRSGDCRCQG
jgi:hypothetical protein